MKSTKRNSGFQNLNKPIKITRELHAIKKTRDKPRFGGVTVGQLDALLVWNATLLVNEFAG